MSFDRLSHSVVVSLIATITGSILLAVHLWIEFSFLLGTVGYILYIAGLTFLVLDIIHQSTRLQSKRMSVWIMSVGLAVLVSFSAVGLVIMFGTFSYVALFGALISLYTMAMLMRWYAMYAKCPVTAYNHPYSDAPIGQHLIVSSHYMWYVLYLVVWIFGMFMAFLSFSTDILWSPWQGLHPLYFVSTIIGGILVIFLLFSRGKTKHILGVLVLQSVLMHVYIPASHMLPWGGDVWRHIGRVEHVLAGEAIRPILFGTDIATVTIGAFDVPAVFVQSQQYAYNLLWGSMSLLHTISGVSLEAISIWLVPILWSVLVPIVLFYIGYLTFGTTRKGLMFSALLLIPFSFQALGSLTLPVSFGYLVFLFALLFLCFALRFHTRLLWIIVCFFVVYLLFVYPIHAILFGVIALFGYVLRMSLEKNNIGLYRWSIGVACISGIAAVLGIELVAGTSVASNNIHILQQAKQMIGELSGYYIASDIRPHDFLSGNIFMNHTPQHAFVSGLFSTFRWHILVFQMSIFVLALYGAIRALVRKRHISLHIFAILGIITILSYIVGWYMLTGDRQLVRRMDAFVAFSIISLAWYGLFGVLEYLQEYTSKYVVTGVFISLAFASVWVGGTTFASGPDMRVVSLQEYTVADHLARMYPNEQCFLADTWTLLVLESKTASTIIGGGFPIDAQYGQEIRTQLYDTLLTKPDESIVKSIANTMPTLTCMIVLPISETNVPLSVYTGLFGTPEEVTNGFIIWRIQLQEMLEPATI